MEILVAPLVIFLFFVAPLWLVLHYRYKGKMSKGISDDELSDIENMLATIDKLTDRVETLERILSDEAPRGQKTNKTSERG